MKIEPRMHELLNRERPGLLAVIGTLGRDSCPQLVPVWYRWDGGSDARVDPGRAGMGEEPEA